MMHTTTKHTRPYFLGHSMAAPLVITISVNVRSICDCWQAQNSFAKGRLRVFLFEIPDKGYAQTAILRMAPMRVRGCVGRTRSHFFLGNEENNFGYSNIL